MDYATRFVQHLKSYFDTVPITVWRDFERHLIPGRVWDENSILRTSIIKDGFDTKRYLNDANDNPVYELEVKTQDYGGSTEETLTGADLALVLQLKANRTLIANRVVLVQLKRAYYENGTTAFRELHHASGGKYFGRDFHQAQKMMFFSTAPVYWLAMSPGILQDESSLGVYSNQSSLARAGRSPLTSEFGGHFGSNYGSPLDPLLGMAPFSSLSPGEIEEYCDLIAHYGPFHRLWRRLRRSGPAQMQRNLQYVEDNLPYHLFSVLRSRLQQYAFDNAGMPARMGLFVCNAEDVYSLSHSRKCGFKDIYPHSVPFTQFMLQNLLAERFGDANEALISAILQRDTKGYFRERLKQLAEGLDFRVPAAVSDVLPVRYSIVVSLQMRTLVDQDRG